ncbi:MAG: DNA repair protein RadA [Patescibacteria group bacterium]
MYSCTKCDAQATKWEGRCTECGAWGSLVEEETSSIKIKQLNKAVSAKSARLLDSKKTASLPRLSTNEPEIDRVLGGGIVAGSLILLSGEPGIGQSTMVAAIAGGIGSNSNPPVFPLENGGAQRSVPPLSKGGLGGVCDKTVLYISGEESPAQLVGRFERLNSNIEKINVLELLPVEILVATIEKEKPALVVVDSIQTLTSNLLDSTAGGPTLIRYATSLFLDLAKRTDIPILLVGQVTKDGSVAGPKTLEHLVDVVLSLDGDPVHAYRLLRATKNRFGATGEIGVFEMTGSGLTPVKNPSAKFLEERVEVPGSVITAVIEGSRVFLVEVQALVEKTSFGMPIRRASGFDQNRLQMLCAILSKRAGLKLGDQDIYINVIGGLDLKEPAVDLAICAAIISAYKGEAKLATLFVGEVGLGGEVRSVPFLDRRISEAKRLGIEKTVTPGIVKKLTDMLG